MKISINYITNIPLTQEGGGWSGMSKNVFLQLSKFSTVHSVDGVNPPVSFWARMQSRIERAFGMAALFPAFSTKRLTGIARQVQAGINPSCTVNFFHGSTPWLKVKSELPYCCYLDASFSTYLKVYHRDIAFRTSKLMEAERIFFSNAKAVFFSSRWALEMTRKDYDLAGENFHVVGLGGNIPFQDLPGEVKNQIVFIGLDFAGKGGYLVVEAFQKVQEKYKDLRLLLVGAQPPAEVLTVKNVVYAGLLNKKKPDDLLRFQSILTESKALLLPTSRDMTPLVIIEAGYFGCPSIATQAYGIPEIISDSGFLCQVPVTPASLALAMEEALTKPVDRDAIRAFYQQKFTWDSTGEKIRDVICSA
jgi:glycosyltransferase involved in cell wall biosynthesis